MKTGNKIISKVMIAFAVILLALIVKTDGQKVYAESLYRVSGDTIYVNISDTSKAFTSIDAALAYAHENYRDDRIYTVKVPAGSYKLNGTLHIYGNTTLDVTDVKFQCIKESGNMLMLGKPSYNKNESVMGGYGTVKNITILGGIWTGNNASKSSLVRMAHGSNIKFEGCTFRQGGCSHQMEVAAIDGFTVKNCVFKDMYDTGKGGKKEALQLDMPTSKYVFSGVILDGTPMKNVVINGCTFQNVPRGLGTHNMLIGQYHTNIQIINNTFENVNGECIVALNYTHCKISNNKISDCGAGILFESFRPQLDEDWEELKAIYTTIYDGKQKFEGTPNANADTVISNNSISLDSDLYADEYVGIRVFGFNLDEDFQATGHGSADYIPQNNYCISNVKVTGNTIHTSGIGIHFSDVQNSVISSNKITNDNEDSCDDGIAVDTESKNITIENNTIKDATEHGIKLEDGSVAKHITKNHISNSNVYGIYVYGESEVSGNIEKNVISNTDDNGIAVGNLSAIKNITGNTITSANWHGIIVYDESKITGEISKNKITNSKMNGIFLTEYSKADGITSNTLTSNGNYAIALYEGSSVAGDIASNHINKNKKHGIQVKLYSYVKEIKSNTITNTKGKGICIEQSATIKEMISKNFIKAISQEGIYIHSNSNAFSIKGNKISSCGRNPILIDTASKKKITVTKNKLNVTKGMQKLLVLKGNVKSDIKKKKAKSKK